MAKWPAVGRKPLLHDECGQARPRLPACLLVSFSPLAIHKPKIKHTLQHASNRRVQDPLQPPSLLEMDREDVVVEVVRDERRAAGA